MHAHSRQNAFQFVCTRHGCQPVRDKTPPTVENVLAKGTGTDMDEDMDAGRGIDLDMLPGEWYLDRAASTILYAAVSEEEARALVSGGQAGAGAVAAVEEVVLAANATSGHSWEDLAFEHGTWLRPGQGGGFVEQQTAACDLCTDVPSKDRGMCGAHDNYAITPGNVRVVGGSGLKFERCAFRRMGAYAAQAVGGSRQIEWAGCLFEDVSAGALMLGDVTTWNYTQVHLCLRVCMRVCM